MGIILLAVLLGIEVFFFAWTLRSKERRAREKSIVRLAAFALTVLLLLTGVLQWSFRYYGLVAILGVQAAFAVRNLLRNEAKQRPYTLGSSVAKLILGVFLCVFAVFPAVMFPQFKPVEPTGELTVASESFVWTDSSREEAFTAAAGDNRFVNVLFYYPQEEGIYPLVIFSHGAFGYNGTNQSAYEDLASNGYVVASISHPYHAFYSQNPDGGAVIANTDFINSVYEVNNMEDGPEKTVIIDKWMDLRVADMNFVLDTILQISKGENPLQQEVQPSEELLGKINMEKIGLFGHSLGGAASVELGRQRSDIGAVIDLDGSMLGEDLQDDTPYPVPLLDVYAEDHYAAALELGETYLNFHTEALAKEAYRAVLKGAGHMNFTDLPMFSPFLASLLGSGTGLDGAGTIDGREGVETMNGWVLGFFDYALKDGALPAFE